MYLRKATGKSSGSLVLRGDATSSVIDVGATLVKDQFESKSAPPGADKSLTRYTDPEPDGG